MNDDPEVKEINEDDDQPATRNLVRDAVDGLRTDLITEIEGTETRLAAKIDDISGTLAKISDQLDRVENNTKGIPEDVEKLKAAVFPQQGRR